MMQPSIFIRQRLFNRAHRHRNMSHMKVKDCVLMSRGDLWETLCVKLRKVAQMGIEKYLIMRALQFSIQFTVKIRKETSLMSHLHHMLILIHYNRVDSAKTIDALLRVTLSYPPRPSWCYPHQLHPTMKTKINLMRRLSGAFWPLTAAHLP